MGRHLVEREPGGKARRPVDRAAFDELDEMIRQGYGEVPQWQLPPDWRTVHFRDQAGWKVRYGIGMPEEMLPRRKGEEVVATAAAGK